MDHGDLAPVASDWLADPGNPAPSAVNSGRSVVPYANPRDRATTDTHANRTRKSRERCLPSDGSLFAQYLQIPQNPPQISQENLRGDHYISLTSRSRERERERERERDRSRFKKRRGDGDGGDRGQRGGGGGGRRKQFVGGSEVDRRGC